MTKGEGRRAKGERRMNEIGFALLAFFNLKLRL